MWRLWLELIPHRDETGSTRSMGNPRPTSDNGDVTDRAVSPHCPQDSKNRPRRGLGRFLARAGNAPSQASPVWNLLKVDALPVAHRYRTPPHAAPASQPERPGVTIPL